MALLYGLVTYKQIIDDSVPTDPSDNWDSNLDWNMVRKEFPSLDWSSEKYKKLKYLSFSQKDKFIHKTRFVFADPHIIKEEYYPGIKAPPYCQNLWLRRLKFEQNQSIMNVLREIGNFSVEEVTAEMRGYYTFWLLPRFVVSNIFLYYFYIFCC